MKRISGIDAVAENFAAEVAAFFTRRIAAFFVVFPLIATDAAVRAEEESSAARIAQWVAQLGDDDYHLREAAHEKLRESGMKAIYDLRKATEHPDAEIAVRAKELLQEIEHEWVGTRDVPHVRDLMSAYAKATDFREKIAVVGSLTPCMSWSGENRLTNGQGIGALCRILQYEQDVRVRAEAVRCLIAVPPCRYSVRHQWFKKAREMISEPQSDPLSHLVHDFSGVREEAMRHREENLFRDTPLPPGEELLDRVEKLSRDMIAFRENPTWQSGREGTEQDILFLYALAELQDAVDLRDARDATVAGALDVIPVTTENEVSPYMSHVLASMYLGERYMIPWAKNEILMVAEKDERFRSTAYRRAGQYADLMDDREQAARYFALAVELTADPTSRANEFFSENRNYLIADRKHNEAMNCAARGEIEAAKKLLDEAAGVFPAHVDVLILRDRLGKDDREYAKKTKSLIDAFIAEQKNLVRRFVNVSGINEQLTAPFNQSAWLLANTEGEYRYAMNCARKATQLDPENPGLLDTLAHVYVLGGEYDKAVEIQRDAVKLAPGVALFERILKDFERRAANAKKANP